jgi:hypothetical protein
VGPEGPEGLEGLVPAPMIGARANARRKAVERVIKADF